MVALDRHRLLLVNDDGIHAPGLELLERLVTPWVAEVWVIAPDEERSGASHSLSMSMPVRMRQLSDRRFAIKGTPTDAVLLAVRHIMAEPPTALVSGINRGANLAEDLTYSGTAAGAIEGALLGIPSIAISQVLTDPRGQARWDTAELWAARVLRWLLSRAAWQPGQFFNVNIPDQPPEAVTGVRATRQGRRPPGSFQPQRRIDERGVPYFWHRIAYTSGAIETGTDLEAMRDGAVSVTPMQLDFTDHDALQRLGELLTQDPPRAGADG
ncbi:MAG: 5'/3'-nucleotidase SurE [Rhodothalassiaceae bacterium]